MYVEISFCIHPKLLLYLSFVYHVSAEEPQWVEVLTEVLLSLLTRPSSLFRHLVDHIFAILTPHLTFAALNLCIEVSCIFLLANKTSVATYVYS